MAMQEENERLRQRIAALRPGRDTSATEAALTADPAGQSEGQGSWTASANAAAVPDQGDDPSHPAIDQTFFIKLQAELSSVKQSLLDKQLELARLQGTNPDEASTEVAAVRQLLLQRHLELLAVRAESEALGLVVNNLRDEMDESVKQREEIGDLLAVVDGATGFRPDASTAEDQPTNDDAVDRSGEKDSSSAAAVPSETMNMPQLFEDHAPEEQTEKALIELGGWVEQAVQDWAGVSVKLMICSWIDADQVLRARTAWRHIGMNWRSTCNSCLKRPRHHDRCTSLHQDAENLEQCDRSVLHDCVITEC